MDKTKRRRQRAVATTGADADKAEYIRALIRSGELSIDEVALAAHLRHKSAALALGLDGRAPLHVHHWAVGLARFGKRVMVQAGHAMAIKCLPLAQQHQYIWRESMPEIVDCATAWLRDDLPTQNASRAAEISRQICEQFADHAVSSLGSRTNMAFDVVLTLGLLLGADEAEPMSSFTPIELWDETPADPSWMYFARMAWITAWITDNSSRGAYQYVYSEPCRAAVLHTIKFLRSRMLTDEKWKRF